MVSFIYDELLTIVESISVPALERFPLFKARVVSAAKALIDRCVEQTREQVGLLIAMEAHYINFEHKTFVERNSQLIENRATLQKREFDKLRKEKEAAAKLQSATKTEDLKAASGMIGDSDSEESDGGAPSGRSVYC